MKTFREYLEEVMGSPSVPGRGMMSGNVTTMGPQGQMTGGTTKKWPIRKNQTTIRMQKPGRGGGVGGLQERKLP